MRGSSGRCDWRVVAATALTMLVPGVLHAQTGSISGTVTNGATPIQGVVVQLYNSSESFVASSSPTSASGAYTIASLAPGTYYAFAWAGNISGNYVDELYPNTQCAAGPYTGGNYCRVNSGGPIVVTAGVTTPGIDFDLAVGGSVSGTVTAAGAGNAGAFIELHIDVGATGSLNVRSSGTSASGAYSIGRLPPGTYYAWAGNVTGGAASGYVPELYSDIPCTKAVNTIPMTGAGCSIANATAIPVAAGASTDVSMDLALGGAFTGTILGGGLPRDEAGVSVAPAVGNVQLNATTSALTGRYLVRGLPAGNHAVNAFATGYFIQPGNVTVTAGAIAAGPDFNLQPGFPGIPSQYQPQTRAVMAGQPTTLSVTALGQAPLSYQWYVGFSGDTSSPILGATSRDYTTGPVTGATNYWVRVSNGVGFTNSQTATVHLASVGTGTVSGTITSGGQPVPNATVTIYTSSEALVTTSTRTSSTGAFAVAGLAPGTYYALASFYGVAGNVTGSLVAPVDFPYTDTLYPNLPCAGAHNTGNYCRISSGTPIVVAADAVTAGTNFDMATGGRITGALTLNGQVPGPSAGALVAIIVDSPGPSRVVAYGHVDPIGTLVLPRLPAGAYRATAVASGMTSEVWDDVGCPAFNCLAAGGTPIVVTAGGTVTGRDFDLTTAPSPPSIAVPPQSQTLASGQSATLSVTPAGTGPFFYQWYRVPAGGFPQLIAGATSSIYNTGPLGRGMHAFFVSVSNYGGSVNSPTAELSVGHGAPIGGGLGTGNGWSSGTIGPVPLAAPRRVPPPR
jgi:hypothetical protein